MKRLGIKTSNVGGRPAGGKARTVFCPNYLCKEQELSDELNAAKYETKGRFTKDKTGKCKQKADTGNQEGVSIKGGSCEVKVPEKDTSPNLVS